MTQLMMGVFHVKEHDVILVKVDRRITAEAAKQLQQQTETLFPGHRVMVLPPEIELRAVDQAVLDQVLERVGTEEAT